MPCTESCTCKFDEIAQHANAICFASLTAFNQRIWHRFPHVSIAQCNNAACSSLLSKKWYQISRSKYLFCNSETCEEKHLQPVALLQQPLESHAVVSFNVFFFFTLCPNGGGSVSTLIMSQDNQYLFYHISSALFMGPVWTWRAWAAPSVNSSRAVVTLEQVPLRPAEAVDSEDPSCRALKGWLTALTNASLAASQFSVFS